MASNATQWVYFGAGIERSEDSKYVTFRVSKDAPILNTTTDDSGNPKNHVLAKSGGFQPASTDGLRVNLVAMRSAR